MIPLVRSFHHLATSTWTHVIADPATLRAAIIDPVLDFDAASGHLSANSARRVVEYLGTTGLMVDWILETHAHADHLTAAAWLKRELAISGSTPEIGIGSRIVEVQACFKKQLNLDDTFFADGRQFDRLFDDGDTFRIGELDVRVIATPGHTPDGVSYLVGDAVFIGDTLFAQRGGSARCDFPGADAATLYRSIQRLYALPDSTRVFLAHDYPPKDEEPIAQTSIGEQKASNTHVRADTSEDEYVTLRTRRDAILPTPKLLWPALQVNIRGGQLPPVEANGEIFLKLPLRTDGLASP
jgi:glyoxylase-like metal-dependent hydrolase (beta-lactamase superfamily II)